MSLKGILLDWNGTLTSDLKEAVFFKELISKIPRKGICFWPKLLFLKIFSKLLRTQQLVDFINRHFVSRLTPEILSDFLSEYPRVCNVSLNEELINVLRSLKKKHQISCGLISSGYIENIRKSLEQKNFCFDFIKANDFSIKDGKMHFDFSVFANKEMFLNEFCHKFKLKASEVAFIGDDIEDIELFKAVGFPILSPLVSSVKGKRLFKSRCNNIFLTKDNVELDGYLKSTIGS